MLLLIPKLVDEINQLKGRVGRLERAKGKDCNCSIVTIYLDNGPINQRNLNGIKFENRFKLIVKPLVIFVKQKRW